jgi:hypothetical protein
MDVFDFVTKLALLGAGSALGIVLVDVLDPATPPIGRLLARARAYVQESLSDD